MFFFFQAEDGIRDLTVTGVQTCALPISAFPSRAVWRLVRSLAAEGKAVLLATSDVDALPDVADRIAWLEQGSVRALGEPSLLAEDAMCDAGLGTTVAGLWHAAGLGAPYPLTVVDALQRWR